MAGQSNLQAGCGCAVLILLAIIIVSGCMAIFGGDSGDSGESTAEERRKGFHCLSSWDGNHNGLEELVRRRLNDPGSMETHETRIGPVDSSGRHRIIMDFSAKNAFGGRVRSTATGWVDNRTCEATLGSID